jgi:hydrogenase maturation protease
MAETLIIGVGSPHGDDRVAWVALEQLAHHAQVRAAGDSIALESLDRPGATLIGRWQGARKVVLIDAVRSGAPVGTLHRVVPDDLLASEGVASSHGFGVSDTLRLAEQLNALPEQLVILGIEAGAAGGPGEALSAELRQALPALVEAAVREVGATAQRGPA